MTPSVQFKDEVMAPLEQSKAPGAPVMTIAIAVAAGVVMSVALVGGLIYWMAKSGRLPLAVASAKTAASASAEPSAAPKTHPVVLEPILANLADPGGAAYLRVSITLRVLDEVPAKGEKAKEEKAAEKPEKGKAGGSENEAAVRDAALDVIGRMTATELLQTDGKEKLKRLLTAAVAQHVPEMKVTGVYFTEFLVQQ